jgi:hypothetical protein
MFDFGDISDPDELSTISLKRKNPKGKVSKTFFIFYILRQCILHK